MVNFSNKDLILFDFCETLVDFQTADAYVDFVRKNIDSPRMQFLEFTLKLFKKIKIISLCYKFFPNKSIEKRLKLYQLKGLNEIILKDLAGLFYSLEVKPNLIPETLELMNDCIKKNCEVVLISGGYSIYLQHFCNEYHIKKLYSTDVAFSENKCSGKILGLDCLFENKVTLIENGGLNLSDYETKVVFTDSSSDLPLLNWADKGFVISKNIPQSWATELNFEQIIWRK